MHRIAILAALLAAPALAEQITVDPIPDGFDMPGFACEDLDVAQSACTMDAGMTSDFCLAVDANGEPLANSTGFTDDGLVLFQNVDASEIAAVRCRNL